MAELGTALGRAGIKIEAVEIVNRQLETRVQMAENGREKIMQLYNNTDLSGMHCLQPNAMSSVALS